MSATKQTRCPHCTSVFNITDEQLAARGGHVRCGSCLQVFRADQHLVEGENGQLTPQASKPTESMATPPSTNSTSMPIVARSQHPTPPPQNQKATSKKRNKDDESWAMDLLGDLDADLEDLNKFSAPPAKKREPTPPPINKPATKKPLFDDEISDLLQEAWVTPNEKNHLKGLDDVDKIKASADESWAQALMSELEEEEKKEKSKNYSMELQPQKNKDAARKREALENKVSNESPTAKPETNQKAEKEDDLLNFLNNNAATPSTINKNAQLPLEIKTKPMISINWGYWLTWSLMCSFAALLLGVQYVYFHFNELALNEKTRPQIVQLCTTLGCRVPEPPNELLINIQKFVVRKPPDVPNALQVNAIVFNKAQFAQPLPALKLTFLDKKREVTAARVFQPKEYLQGDSAHNLRRIPPETPIHIQLDIVNPKVNMASYKLKPLFK